MRAPVRPLSSCPALRHLQLEHLQLMEQVYAIQQLADRIQIATAACYQDLLRPLHEHVTAFAHGLSRHAAKEEQLLYPLLEKNLQHERGPIAAMKCEHEQIRFHLQTFFRHMEDMQEPVPKAETKALLYHIGEMCALTTAHITREEQLLLPLAEALLTAEDLQQLASRICAS